MDTAKKVWDAIKTRHMGADRVKEARLQTLMAEFDRLKMKDNESIDEFSGRISEISSKSAALGEELEEPKLVKKFLKKSSSQKVHTYRSGIGTSSGLEDNQFRGYHRTLKGL